ncbi:FecR family protein [Dyadobacter fermentans]|uniref:Anti-FecI sigma factor, FecR n=1 Tax=Dyadobacter fermentans (strain ATCC 700827 / DSM 18053 / CIP 107007 / KCTC 52180 / NS114) TaxID=471854 RepID=C6W4T4_DYAFD|nr:FecR family protein [Dyadobacter fermentans]ACT95908.1 anti-FecI sigma factor, FecR [Dyadobacter fermentans DSM 18053]
MDRYNDFSVEDFVWDDFFRQWTLSPTSETDALWDDWIDANPEMFEKVEQAKAIVLSLRLHEPEIGDAEISQVVKQTVGRVTGAEEETLRPSGRLVPAFSINWMQFAASVAFIMLLGWAVYSVMIKRNDRPQLVQQGNVIEQTAQWTEKHNTTTQTIDIALNDGSRISLEPRGRIRYPEKFDGPRREVFLEGEAFFDIAKDPAHPFLVYANGLVTKVLGTSFRIKAYDGAREVTVEVKTGKVSVFAQSDPDLKEKLDDTQLQGVVLTPNQKIVYARNEVKMLKTLVEKPEMVVPKADVPQFSFEDTPASEVFNTIAKAYGIDILYDEALLKDCPLTAMLDNQTLHDKLDIICKAVESSYQIVDGQVVIHSKGCRN